MSDITVISAVCERLNVTSRTLRYYEEIGLIESVRQGDGNYRYYTPEMIRRIEQILAMRKMTLTVKEIQTILKSHTTESVINIFMNKLEMLKGDLSENVKLIQTIEEMIKVLKINQLQTFHQIPNMTDILYDEEPSEIEDILDNSDLLHEWNIRMIKLHPMRVASYVYYGEQPEDEAWKVLKNWVKEQGLSEEFSTRYFGFNNPDPQKGESKYGYEVWATVGDDIEGNEQIKIKEFKGGLYAVTTTTIENIVSNWQHLYKIVNGSKNYSIGERWLEEHLIVNDFSWDKNFQVDLYCPLVKGDK